MAMLNNQMVSVALYLLAMPVVPGMQSKMSQLLWQKLARAIFICCRITEPRMMMSIDGVIMVGECHSDFGHVLRHCANNMRPCLKM